MHDAAHNPACMDAAGLPPDSLDLFVQLCERCARSSSTCICDCPNQAEGQAAKDGHFTTGQRTSSQADMPKTSTSSGMQADMGKASRSRDMRGPRHVPSGAIAMFRQVVETPYSSRMARHHKVCLKIKSGLQADELPSGLKKSFQQALSALGPGAAIHDVCIRPGCVVISMDIMCDVNGMSSTEDIFNALKAKLEELLSRSQAEQEGGIAARKSGDYMRLQINTRVASMVWSATKQAWALQHEDAASGATAAECAEMLSTAPYITCAFPVAENASSLIHTNNMLKSMSRSLDGCQSICCMNVVVEVQGLGKMTEVAGWAPASPTSGNASPAHLRTARDPVSDEGSEPGTELVARGSPGSGYGSVTSRWDEPVTVLARHALSGSYLTTRVVSMQRQVSRPDLIKVEVDIPDHMLVRHDQDGIPSTIVLLQLELCQSEFVLSEYPVLELHRPVTSTDNAVTNSPSGMVEGAGTVPPVHNGSSNSNSGGNIRSNTQPDTRPVSGAWWWGASDTAVENALGDIRRLLIRSSNKVSADAGVYLGDLRVWLQEIRRATLSHGQCVARTCMHACDDDEPVLTAQEMRDLSEDLIAYATCQGMDGVVEMVTQQAKSTPVLSWVTHHRIPSSLRNGLWFTRVMMAGYGCSMCEASYKARLAQQLMGVQMASSTAVALSGVASAARSFLEPSELQYGLLVTPWFVLHSIAILQLLGVYRPARVYATSAAATAAAPLTWCVYAYAWRIMIQTVYGIGIVPAPAISVKVFRGPAWSWALPHLMFAFAEQLQATAVLPTGKVTLLVLLADLPSVVLNAVNQGRSVTSAAFIAAVVVVLSRLVLDARLRGLLTFKYGRRSGRRNLDGAMNGHGHASGVVCDKKKA